MSKKNKKEPSPAGNMVIGQSGGPTVVINQSLTGAVLEAKKHSKFIKKIYGARHGVRGVLEQNLVELGSLSKGDWEKIAITPASALGSVRKKPSRDECLAMFKVLKAHDVRYFFYVGGNDSAETANIVHEVAVAEAYDLRVFHIPKTIDNDLLGTDHCPGFGSAAKFVAQAFMGDDQDNRALPGIKVNVIMGRHAGFLTAAAALGRARADSGPHLVYLPEVPFDEEKFVADVKKVYKKFGRCMIAVSEGIADKDGKAIAEKFIKEVDSHGNAQLSGSGALGDFLAELIKRSFGEEKIRVRADTFGYLQRSFAGVISKVDAKEAREVGRLAVRAAVEGVTSGTVSMVREKTRKGKYKIGYKISPLSSVAKNTTHVPPQYINKDGNNVTPAFLKYALPLVGKLPEIGFVEGKAVGKLKL